MSVIFELNNCKLIDGEGKVVRYEENGKLVKLKLSENIFMNFKRKQKNLKKENASEDADLEQIIKDFLTVCKSRNFFQQFNTDDIERYKTENIELMNQFYQCSNDFGEFRGENSLDTGVLTTINDMKYYIPPKCRFFNKNIKDISSFLPTSEKFDFIVIDPPWTNRYIKRLKKTNKGSSYQMMSDDDIMNIPIENYTHKNSIVAIWCTNSSAHQAAIDHQFLSKWNLKVVAKWKWVKIDKCGELFCSWEEGSKKPYETIYICSHVENDILRESILGDFLIFSHPSSIHSHKPQLIGILMLNFLLQLCNCLRKLFQSSLVTFCLHQLQSALKSSQEAFIPILRQSGWKLYGFKMLFFSTKLNHQPAHSSQMCGAPAQLQKQIDSNAVDYHDDEHCDDDCARYDP